MLIIPPAPEHWSALADLLRSAEAPWREDLERRLTDGVAGAQDAVAVVPDRGHFQAVAVINKLDDVGLLTHGYTRPEQRRRGYARRLVDTLVSWFEMTGGRWLYLSTTVELDAAFYGKFGFQPLRRAVWQPVDRQTMVRPAPGATGSPYDDVSGDVTVRPISRAEWPAMVALLQYCAGPDPRVPLDESAVTAEALTLDLITHQERDRGRLLGAFRGPRLVALASVATDRHHKRTYALLMPHHQAPLPLREAVAELAQRQGYEAVEFPMEVLGNWHHGESGAGPAVPGPSSGG
jgi:GNAT superfamily N-acetyltransferase